MYSNLRQRLEDMIRGETNFIANASTFSSLIFNGIKDINWVGFYLISEEQLVLGPFQGKPACFRIPLGKGVCGGAVLHKKPYIVSNVHIFPGHIPCDPTTNAEIVIPLIRNDIAFGVFDMDSPVLNRFNEDDERQLIELLDILIDNSDITAISNYYQKS